MLMAAATLLMYWSKLTSRLTPEQMKELHHELTRLNNEQECPDTDDVVEEAVKNTLGETARCIGYALLEYGGAGRHCDENFH